MADAEVPAEEEKKKKKKRKSEAVEAEVSELVVEKKVKKSKKDKAVVVEVCRIVPFRDRAALMCTYAGDCCRDRCRGRSGCCSSKGGEEATKEAGQGLRLMRKLSLFLSVRSLAGDAVILHFLYFLLVNSILCTTHPTLRLVSTQASKERMLSLRTRELQNPPKKSRRAKFDFTRHRGNRAAREQGACRQTATRSG